MFLQRLRSSSFLPHAGAEREAFRTGETTSKSLLLSTCPLARTQPQRTLWVAAEPFHSPQLVQQHQGTKSSSETSLGSRVILMQKWSSF